MGLPESGASRRVAAVAGVTVVKICVVTDSNRPRHSLDENFDDDRPLNLEPHHGVHEDPIDAEFEDEIGRASCRERV